jgi:O-antigen ligase
MEKRYSLEVLFVFLMPIISLVWMQSYFIENIYCHIVIYIVLCFLITCKKKYNLLLFFIFFTFPYLYNPIFLTNFFNPAIYLIFFIVLFLDPDKIRNAQKYFVISLSLIIFSFLIEYFVLFPFPLSYDDLYKNKLLLGYDLTFQSRIFGNVHNILPFIIASFAYSLLFYVKNKDKYSVLLMLFCSIFVVLYIARFAFITMASILILFIVYKVFFQNKKSINLKKILFIIIPFGVFLYFVFNLDYFSVIINTLMNNDKPMDDSLLIRLEAQKKGLELLSEHFLLGVGPQQYAFYDTIHTSPHNFILRHIVENGIAGIIFLFYLFFMIFRNYKSIIYSAPILVFLIYSTMVGADLVMGRLAINYCFILVMFSFLCVHHKEEKKKNFSDIKLGIFNETNPAKS